MTAFVFRHRVLIIVSFALLTVIFALFIPMLRFDGDIQAIAPAKLSSVDAYGQVNSDFGGADSLAVAVASKDLFSVGGLARASGVQEELSALEDVSDVVSVFTYTSPEYRDEALQFPPVVDPGALPADEAGVAAVRERIASDSAISGKLVSEDFDTLLFILQASSTALDSRLIEEVDKVVAAHPEFTFHLAGTPILNDGMVRYMQQDILVFVVFGFLSVVLVLLAGFRSFRGVLLPLLTISSSLIVTFGFMGLVGAKITIVALIIPVMLIAICNNYAIHFLTKYYEDTLTNGITDRKELIASSFRSLSRPVWLAFLTTVASFLSFVSSPIPRVVEMGIFIAFGICFSFIMTLLFIPALLTMFPLPEVRGRRHPQNTFFSRFAARLGPVFSRRKVLITTGSLAAAAAAVFFIPAIRVDSDIANYFNKNDPIRVSIDYINREVGGAQMIKVVLPGDPREAASLALADEFRKKAEGIDGVGSTYSVVDSISSLNRVLHDGDPAWNVPPVEDGAAAELFFLIETSLSPERLTQLVAEDYSRMAVSVQLRTTESGDVDRIAAALKEESGRLYGPDAGDVVIAGVPLIASQLNGLVIISMIQSLILALVMIFASVAVGFRSAAAGAACSFVMGVIITLVFGIMGVLGIELSSATALVASITLGVGIDYSIHFAARWFRERKETGSDAAAVTRTVATTGKGIVINALAIACSVVPAFFSQFRPVMYFGVLCFVSILFSLLGGVGLMPAILSLLPERSHEKTV